MRNLKDKLLSALNDTRVDTTVWDDWSDPLAIKVRDGVLSLSSPRADLCFSGEELDTLVLTLVRMALAAQDQGS